MYTWTGDANRSGQVDGDDFAKIDAGYSASATDWINGDFDFSGTIDADDYWLIDRTYATQGTPFSPAAPLGVVAVPEPAAVLSLPAAHGDRIAASPAALDHEFSFAARFNIRRAGAVICHGDEGISTLKLPDLRARRSVMGRCLTFCATFEAVRARRIQHRSFNQEKPMCRRVFAAVAAAVSSLDVAALADVIIQPVAIVSNTLGESPNVPASHLIDQSGLSPRYESGFTDFDEYVSGRRAVDGSDSAMWGAQVFHPRGQMVFDLGSPVEVTRFALWNGSGFYRQQIFRFGLRADADGDFSNGAVSLGSFQALNRTQQFDNAYAEVFSFAPTVARYIELDITDNEGNGFGTIANELAFAAVPVQWNLNGSGDYFAAANWSGAIPNAVGQTAFFAQAITAPRTIFADSAVTLGRIVLNNANAYQLTGQGSLTVQAATANAAIQVVQGAHKLNLPTTFAGSGSIDVAAGASLDLADPVVLNAGIVLSKEGGGTLRFTSLLNAGGAATIKVNGGSINFDTAINDPNISIDIDPATVNIGSNQSIHSYRLSGGGNTLNVGRNGAGNDVASSVTADDLIANGGGTDTLRATLASNALSITANFQIGTGNTLVKAGPGTLTIAATAVQNHGAGSTLVVAGGQVNLYGNAGPNLALRPTGGTVNLLASQRIATLDLEAGVVALSAGEDKVLVAGSVSTTGAGRLNVRDNKLIVTSGGAGSWNGSGYDGVTGLIQRGRATGAWDGAGIITSQPDALAQRTSLAVASNGDLHKPTFGGVTVGESDVLVMYTWSGDANLSGHVDGDDFARIDAGYSASSTGWFNGDFDYSGTIDADDYWLIDRTYATQGSPFSPSAPLGVVTVPEPAAVLSLLLLPGMALRRRRRR